MTYITRTPLTLALVMALATATVVLVAPPGEAAPPLCFGREATIIGSDSHNDRERLVGTPGADVIVGRGGTDIIRGRGGNDRICGGSGVDKIAGQGGRDRLASGEGVQGCSEERYYEVMEGNIGSDRVVGGPCLEKLYGGRGPDVITDPSSLLDADWLFGGAGDDEMSFGDDTEEQFGGATFAGGPGDDVMQGDPDSRGTLDYSGSVSSVDVDLSVGRASGEGQDVFQNMIDVVGSSNDDILKGDSGDNGVSGRAGDDNLFGAPGDDSLDGGAGFDEIDGSEGNDSCTRGEVVTNCE